MAFQTIRPMFGTATFYTPQSNFFVDYMFTRLALTNKKNQELARHELDAQNREERGLKDEEVRLRNNITRLQESLLNREQAFISRTFKREQKMSAKSTGNDVRGRREQAVERRGIDARWDKTINKEQQVYAAGQAKLRTAESDIGNHATNLVTKLRSLIKTDPNFWDVNNGGAQIEMVQAYRDNQKGGRRGQGAPSPIDIEGGGAVFTLMYTQILEDFGPVEAESFKNAILVVGYPKVDKKWREMPVLGGVGTGSWEEEHRLYSDTEHVARIQGMNVARREEKAEVPNYGAGSGASSRQTTTGGAPAAALAGSAATEKTEKMIAAYEDRLKEVMEQRESAKGKRGEIIERRLGRKGFARSLTPFEYVDEDVQSILDEVLGIKDEDVRRETLEEGRMLVSGPRGKIANEFVENQVLNEEAITNHYRGAYWKWRNAGEEMAQADAAAVSLRRQLKELEEMAHDDPGVLDTLSPQIEALVANINRQERRALKAEQQHDLYGKIYDQLKPLVASERGVAAEWSAMGPRERLLILQGINAGAIGKASVYEDTISTTRQEIQLLEEQLRDIESDAGPRPEPRRRRGQVGPGGLGLEGSRLGTGLEAPTNFEKNDHAMAALKELEDNKAALQSLLVAQNQHLIFSGEAKGAIDFLVENDPAYRIEPPASRGLGTEAPIPDILTPDEEEAMVKAVGDIGQKEGAEEGEKLGEEARRGQAETEARELGVERVGERIEEIMGKPVPLPTRPPPVEVTEAPSLVVDEAGYEEIEDLSSFLGSEEAKLEARPESEDVGDDVAVPEQRPEEPDYTYELRGPGSVNMGEDEVKWGSSMEELAKKVYEDYGDDTLDVAPSFERIDLDEIEEELNFDPIDLGEIREHGKDFKPGGFEFKPTDLSKIEVEDEQAKTPKTPALPLTYNPELRERLRLEQLEKELAPKPTTNQTIIAGVRASPNPKWLLDFLKKGFQQSEELLEAVRERANNQEFELELQKLSKEDQAQWAAIWDSMQEARDRRKARDWPHVAESQITEGDILAGSMPLGR